MTRDEIIAMAKEAGSGDMGLNMDGSDHLIGLFERFAALVAAAEREACALIAEDGDNEERCTGYYDQLGDAKATARNIAAAIRQRGAA